MREPLPTNEQDNSHDFRDDLRRVWNELPDKKLFGVLLIAWVTMFHFFGNSTFGYIDSASIFHWMYSVYSLPESDDGHGLLIPWVVLAVLWWRRKLLLSLPRNSWWPAVVILLLAICFHLLGFAVQQPRISIISFFLGLYALVGVIWGRDWLKATFMPFSIFAFCVPISTLEVIKNLTTPLRLMATAISTSAAHGVLGFEVTCRGTQILDAAGVARYDVAAACSGIRSLISFLRRN